MLQKKNNEYSKFLNLQLRLQHKVGLTTSSRPVVLKPFYSLDCRPGKCQNGFFGRVDLKSNPQMSKLPTSFLLILFF